MYAKLVSLCGKYSILCFFNTKISKQVFVESGLSNCSVLERASIGSWIMLEA